MREDNRGLTLIELIVTVAIGMVFSGVILTFVAGAAKSYRHTSGGAQSQMDMQDALDSLEDLTMNANVSLYYTKGVNRAAMPGEPIENNRDITHPIMQSKTFFIGRAEDGKMFYYLIIWSKDDKTLYYYQDSLGATSGTGGHGTKEVFAKNVTQFAADISQAANGHTVQFKLVTKVNGREVEKTETVTLRNDVVIAAPGTEETE